MEAALGICRGGFGYIMSREPELRDNCKCMVWCPSHNARRQSSYSLLIVRSCYTYLFFFIQFSLIYFRRFRCRFISRGMLRCDDDICLLSLVAVLVEWPSQNGVMPRSSVPMPALDTHRSQCDVSQHAAVSSPHSCILCMESVPGSVRAALSNTWETDEQLSSPVGDRTGRQCG